MSKLKETNLNNSWIKIEKESDLPKHDCNVWVLFENGEMYVEKFMFCYNNFSVHPYKYITHYKIIEKPEKPIY
jgi:hypothetical protein